MLFSKNKQLFCCVLVSYMRQGMADEPGLGEDQDTAVKNGDEVPEADVELSDDDPPVVKRMKELIIKMTSHSASDRPSAEDVVSVLKELHVKANLSQPDVNSPLRLLQALIDMNQTAIDEIIATPDAKDWINDQVDTKHLENPALDLSWVENFTCLIFASIVSDVRTVRLLVEAGCDVTARDSFGKTPLHWACLSGVDANSKVVYLLQRDASLVNAKDYSNETPLHCAATRGNSDVITTLLGHGVNVNEQGGKGYTVTQPFTVRVDQDALPAFMSSWPVVQILTPRAVTLEQHLFTGRLASIIQTVSRH